MNVTPKDLADIAEQLSQLKDRLEKQAPDNKRLLDILAGIELALVETAEATAEQQESKQLGQLIDAVAKLRFEAPPAKVEVMAAPAAVTVMAAPAAVNLTVPEAKAPIVNVEAAKSWTALQVIPARNKLTGDVESYIIKRLS